MAAQTAKAQVAELVQRLHSAYATQDPVARAAVDLVKLLSDEAKESLVTAAEGDMLRVQGAARALNKLHSDLTSKPLKLQEPTP